MFILFIFNDTATTEIYTLSLHDALPISMRVSRTASSPTYPASGTPSRSIALGTPASRSGPFAPKLSCDALMWPSLASRWNRSEEHTSELQSRQYLVCRLLLEKNKKQKKT